MTSNTRSEQEARIALRLLDAFALEGPAVTSLHQDWPSLMDTKLHGFKSFVLNLKGPNLKRETMPATQDGMSDGAQGEGMAEVPLTAGTLDWHEDATHSREFVGKTVLIRGTDNVVLGLVEFAGLIMKRIMVDRYRIPAVFAVRSVLVGEAIRVPK